ncbi:MAG TPA: hypothetical protein VF498_01875 [Anaerolineales bacterium]
MNLANLSPADLAGALLGFVFTLCIFSYIFGDNVLFRLAIYIFIGVAAGYAAVVAWYNVIWPQLVLPLVAGSPAERFLALFPLVLGVLLLTKTSSRLAVLGNPAMAYLVGVGVATAIGGAILGTIFPQALASINLYDLKAAQQSGGNVLVQLVNGSVVLVGTLTTLMYFHFGARPRLDQAPERSPLVEALAWVGQIFIAITLGALLAGVYAAALSALVERLHFLVQFLLPLILPQ